jgi:O-antigen ligase
VSGAPIKHSVTGLQKAGGSPLAATSPSMADRVLTAATTALLLLAPFAGSAGLRGAALLFAAVALCVHFRAHVPRLGRNFPRAVLVCFGVWAALAIASLTWSRDRPYSAAELKPEILYAALALSFFFMAATAARWRIWWIALMAGTVLAMIGNQLQEVMPFFMSRHSVDGGPGHFSTHLALIAPLLFAIVWPPPWGRGQRPLILAVALALLMTAGWLTGNRMLWPALAAELLVGIAAWRVSSHEEAAASPALSRVMMVAGIVLVVAFAASVMERSGRDSRLASPASTQLERDLRPRIWGVASAHFGEAPWLGHGFGREILAESFIPITPRNMNHPEMRHAHNVFIDVALQLGIVGLAAFVALLFALAREYRGLLADARLAPLGIIGLALIAGFVVKNLTDDFYYRHNGLVFWAINGALLGLAHSARSRP